LRARIESVPRRNIRKVATPPDDEQLPNNFVFGVQPGQAISFFNESLRFLFIKTHEEEALWIVRCPPGDLEIEPSPIALLANKHERKAFDAWLEKIEPLLTAAVQNENPPAVPDKPLAESKKKREGKRKKKNG
jgi:hypothetical protein